MSELTGAQIVAKTLKKLGCKVVFGLVGIPVIEIADALLEEDIKFIGFRNEQSASYAASCYGYLTQTPGVLLLVGGPGIIHGLSGIYNAQQNHWPLFVMAGSIESEIRYKGGFQEYDQLSVMKQFVKFQSRPQKLKDLPRLIIKNWRNCWFGTPGVCYLDLPGDIIVNKDDEVFEEIEKIEKISNVPRFISIKKNLNNAVEEIKKSKFPLIIIGKGSAYSQAAKEITDFINQHQIPFIPTPMGKGVVSDLHELNLSSARSLALKKTDLILVLGARLNWILQFGNGFSKNVKIIQINQNPEEIGENCDIENLKLGLVGDIKETLKELNIIESFEGYKFDTNSISKEINEKIRNNNKSLIVKETSPLINNQLNYHIVYKTIRESLNNNNLSSNTILVSEGANTMDISRLSFPILIPQGRLDAGTTSAMGIGLGYAIAAKVSNPTKLVLAIEGDSAFGFSAIEIETAVRYNLSMVIIVMNNSGIYHGISSPTKFPKPIELSKDVRYDLMAQGLGANGHLVLNIDDLLKSLQVAIVGGVHVINVIIEPGKEKKIQFNWQKSSKL